jgi:hypothetical protein
VTDAPASAASRERDRPVVPRRLLQQDMAMCPCGCIGKRKKGSYLTKTIQGVHCAAWASPGYSP